jgi:hypothetical protein
MPKELLHGLSPSTSSALIIHCEDDPKVGQIIQHIDNTGGGVYAVVGERGSGRSTTLQRVSETRDDVAIIDCPFDGLEALTAELARTSGFPEQSTIEELAARIDEREQEFGIIIDNAHRLIHPVMGGLREFDRLIECARQHSNNCCWIISMDWVVWRFLGQSRAVGLLFDEIVTLDEWPEEDIVELLKTRSAQAGIEPVFDGLLPELPIDADVFERNEALATAALSYYRLIWDYAAGNPGVALHVWSDSLGVAEDGRIHVTPFRAPEATHFDRLPDSAVFVMRAVLQLERARPEDVAKATRVALADVHNALRYGVQNGYLEIEAGRHAVSWNWYRPSG